MHLTVIGPVGHKEERFIDTRGLSLGALLQNIDADVKVNGVETPAWKRFVPENLDRVEVTIPAGVTAAFIGPLIGVAAGSTAAIIAAAVVNAIISLVISMALSAAIKALTPKPKKPKLNSSEQAFGIAGLVIANAHLGDDEQAYNEYQRLGSDKRALLQEQAPRMAELLDEAIEELVNRTS